MNLLQTTLTVAGLSGTWLLLQFLTCLIAVITGNALTRYWDKTEHIRDDYNTRRAQLDQDRDRALAALQDRTQDR